MRLRLKARRRQTLPTTRTDYPKGIAISTEAGRFYLHNDGKRYTIPSEEIYRSWSFPLTVETTEAAVKHIPLALTKLGFRDGTLIYNIKDAKIYLVEHGKRRQIVSPVALQRLGLTMDDAMVVSNYDVSIMKLGDEYA